MWNKNTAGGFGAMFDMLTFGIQGELGFKFKFAQMHKLSYFQRIMDSCQKNRLNWEYITKSWKPGKPLAYIS